jgi:hypothetical protein
MGKATFGLAPLMRGDEAGAHVVTLHKSLKITPSSAHGLWPLTRDYQLRLLAVAGAGLPRTSHTLSANNISNGYIPGLQEKMQLVVSIGPHEIHSDSAACIGRSKGSSRCEWLQLVQVRLLHTIPPPSLPPPLPTPPPLSYSPLAPLLTPCPPTHPLPPSFFCTVCLHSFQSTPAVQAVAFASKPARYSRYFHLPVSPWPHLQHLERGAAGAFCFPSNQRGVFAEGQSVTATVPTAVVRGWRGRYMPVGRRRHGH